MRKLSSVALFATLVISVSVVWVQAKWASTIPEIATCIIASIWTLAFARGSYRPKFTLALVPLCAALMWSCIQIALGFSIYEYESWLGVLYWTGNISAFFVALQAFSDPAIRSAWLRALVALGFLISVQSALQALTSNGKIFWTFPTVFSGWDPMGPFVYHNQFAAFIEILLPVALYNTFMDRSRKAIYVLAAATMYAAVIISASRTGFVLTTAELIVVPLMMKRRKRSPVPGLAVGTAVLVGVVVLLGISAGPEVLAGRFAAKDPYAIRREFVDSSWSMIRARPFRGVGLRNWPTAYPGYALFDNGLVANQAHNDWAQWTVEGGIPLLLLFLWVAIASVPACVRSIWAIGVAAIFLHCLVDYPIQRPAISLLFFTIIGAALAANESG